MEQFVLENMQSFFVVDVPAHTGFFSPLFVTVEGIGFSSSYIFGLVFYRCEFSKSLFRLAVLFQADISVVDK